MINIFYFGFLQNTEELGNFANTFNFIYLFNHLILHVALHKIEVGDDNRVFKTMYVMQQQIHFSESRVGASYSTTILQFSFEEQSWC